MPNLLLTTVCNRSCPYCFAVNAMDAEGAANMSFGEIVDYADQTIAARYSGLSLLGGEPTLHPEFEEICEYLLRRGLSVRVFTNGLIDPDSLGALDAHPRERLAFTLNVNSPDIDVSGHRDRQLAFARRFAANCDLGVNLHRRGLDLSFVVEFAREAGLESAWIRIGFAQPIVGEANEYLEIDAYRELAPSIVDLAEAAFEHALRLSLDCGFPLCAFADDQLGSLYRRGARLKFMCGVPLDVAPGGQAWSCFPLARETRIAHDPQDDLKAVSAAFERQNREARERLGPGIFPECATCPHLKLGQCAGGCLAHLLSR